GELQLVELAQNGGELNRHTGRNILRAAINPVALSSKQTIELQGERAKVQSHAGQPAIFINVDSGPDASQGKPQPAPSQGADRGAPPGAEPPQRYGIVRAERKKGVRVVGSLNVAVYGKVNHKENWIKTTSTPMGEWVRVVPAEPLPPGE